MDTIVKSLREAIGLDASSIGIGAIERAVQTRMSAVNLGSVEEYAVKLEQDPKEIRGLIEAVVVPETWFFRDPGAFAAVSNWASRANPNTHLRFLSVPCATGEEPYSLAMALLDGGIAPERFDIEAVDVSARVVEQAIAGTYGRNSFRSDSLSFRDRYFQKGESTYSLDARIRQLVRFRQANLLEDFTLLPSGTYHAIFCRNLLIYFDAEMQARALSTLRRLLAPDGLLFVAPAESGLMLRHDFSPAGISQAFAFQISRPKKAPAPAHAARPHAAPTVAVRPASIPTPVPSVSPTTPRRRSAAVEAILNVEPVRRAPSLPDLSEANRLANEGRFAEVSAICNAFLQSHGPSADVYCLLALVSDASNSPEQAAGFYRKALYLDPQHHDALAHFSLLAGRMGDAATADALRKRALRLETNSAAK